MKTVSTKLTKADREKQEERWKSPIDAEEYSYSTRLTLDDALVSKIFGDSLPEVGEKLELEGTVEVCAASSSSTTSGKVRGVTLQITKLGLESAVKAEDKLYK